jgi:hypothetical protein
MVSENEIPNTKKQIFIGVFLFILFFALPEIEYLIRGLYDPAYFSDRRAYVRQEYAKIKPPEKVTKIDESVLSKRLVLSIYTTYLIEAESTDLQERQQEIEKYYYHELSNNGWELYGKSDHHGAIYFSKGKLGFDLRFLKENQLDTSISFEEPD